MKRTVERKKRRFDLGRVVVTRAAVQELLPCDMFSALGRHVHGDWGEVGEEDWQANEVAVAEGDRLLSVYRSSKGVKFYVITEHDRSLTTILLPSDY